MDNGKAENGRFKKGWKGGPGRPRNPAKEDWRALTLAMQCSQERWANIVERAILDAEAGDSRARDWLSKYLLPSPEQVTKIFLERSAADPADMTDDELVSILRERTGE